MPDGLLWRRVCVCARESLCVDSFEPFQRTWNVSNAKKVSVYYIVYGYWRNLAGFYYFC